MTGLAFPKPTRKTRPPRRLRRRQTLGAVRAERKSAGPGVTPEQWLEILAWYSERKWRCAYHLPGECKGRIVREHVIPLAKGGLDEQSNLVPACSEGNTAKGTALWEPLLRHPFKSEAAA